MADTISEYFEEFRRYFPYVRGETKDWRKIDLFNSLAQAMGWDARDPERKTQYDRFKRSWVGVVEAEFAGNSLSDYQQLCRELSIGPIPGSIPECIERLSTVYVNIVDLVQYRKDKRARRYTEPLQWFDTQEELENYTKESRKWYPSGNANGEMLRVLLKQF